jgi:hypothetical protein
MRHGELLQVEINDPKDSSFQTAKTQNKKQE